MANTDNELHGLKIDDLYSKSTDTLGDCYNHQKKMQENTYGYNFKEMTIGEIVDFCFMNKHAIEDEFGEFMDALGVFKTAVEMQVGNLGRKLMLILENKRFLTYLLTI
jgi:hypothetical protein